MRKFCMKFKIIVTSFILCCFMGAAYNITREIRLNQVRSSASCWFQEIEQARNIISKTTIMPSHFSSEVASFSSETIYRDQNIPTGPPTPSYQVGEDKNFGLAK